MAVIDHSGSDNAVFHQFFPKHMCRVQCKSLLVQTLAVVARESAVCGGLERWHAGSCSIRLSDVTTSSTAQDISIRTGRVGFLREVLLSLST